VSGPPRVTLLERVELGSPAGYWEGHLADGRAEAIARLLEWMGPLDGIPVLDAGCGHGTAAVELARRGARVLACDRDPARVAATRRRARETGLAVATLVADLEEPGLSPARPVTWWCWELFEHLALEQRRRLFRRMEESRASALFFAVRAESRLGALVAPLLAAGGTDQRGEPALPTLDPVPLLREIHLETDLRLERTETLRRRNSALAIARMRRPADG
jgi:SAM-dependent methyltransferase